MTIDMLPWIVARAAGLTAYGLMAATMLAGLLVKTKTPVGELKGTGMVDLHRHFSLLALAATGVHGLALVLDTTVEISLAALAVPGLVPYRPAWTALGVVAAWAALVVHLSFSVRKRIGPKNWRRLHWITYAAFLGATAHGIGAGTDTPRPWALALYGGTVTAIAALTGWRATTARRARGRSVRQHAPRPARIDERRPATGEAA